METKGWSASAVAMRGRPRKNTASASGKPGPGDNATARERYREFLTISKDADPDRPEVATAKEFLAKKRIAKK
jgi:hypothetical protein